MTLSKTTLLIKHKTSAPVSKSAVILKGGVDANKLNHRVRQTTDCDLSLIEIRDIGITPT